MSKLTAILKQLPKSKRFICAEHTLGKRFAFGVRSWSQDEKQTPSVDVKNSGSII